MDDPKDKTFAPFADARCEIEHGRIVKSREMYFAIYQAIARDERRPGLYREFPPDFFDLIIVDECHREGLPRITVPAPVLTMSLQPSISRLIVQIWPLAGLNFTDPPLLTWTALPAGSAGSADGAGEGRCIPHADAQARPA